LITQIGVNHFLKTRHSKKLATLHLHFAPRNRNQHPTSTTVVMGHAGELAEANLKGDTRGTEGGKPEHSTLKETADPLRGMGNASVRQLPEERFFEGVNR